VLFSSLLLSPVVVSAGVGSGSAGFSGAFGSGVQMA